MGEERWTEGLLRGLLGHKCLPYHGLFNLVVNANQASGTTGETWGDTSEEEEPQVSSVTAFQVLLALKLQPTPHTAPKVPVTVENQREEAFVHPPVG